MPITGSQKALMYARSGIMRSGASRSGYYQSYLIVRVGGVDRSAKVEKGTLSIDYARGQQTDTGSMSVFGFDPSPGQTVIVADGALDNRVFGGTIQTTHQDQEFGKATSKKLWGVTLTDWTWMLNRRRVIKQYPAGMPANLAAADLITSYGSGFSIAKIRSGAPALTGPLSFRGTPLGEAVAQLADAVNWLCYTDPDQVVHFASMETDQAPTALQVGTYTYDNLELLFDVSQIRTRMYGVGGGAQTTAPVPASSTSIPVNECGWYSATGGFILAGSNIITYTGVSTSSGEGNVTGCSGVVYDILQGDTCNVFVQVDDVPAQTALAALVGGDGIRDGWLEDGNWSLATVTQQANASIAAFKNQDVRGSYDTYDRFTGVGKQVTINLPSRGINTTVVLQRVNRRLASPLGRTSGIGGGWVFKAEFAIVWNDLVDLLTRQVGPS